MQPLVSILIPAYNAGPLLADTVRSALAQSWPRKEIILVDDGSKDDTLAVAKQFESAEVKVVTQANQGAAATRNRAFYLAQGDYIQWLDADDLLSPPAATGVRARCCPRAGRISCSARTRRISRRPCCGKI